METGVAADEMDEQTENSSSSEPMSEHDSLQAIHLLWNELCRLCYDYISLVTLETQRAGESLVTMIVAAVMVAFLLSSAWLGCMAVIVLIILDWGVAASSAILLAVAFNLLLALLFCGVIRRKRRYLKFPATRRSFEATDSAERVKES